jgi:5'-nucleotidase
MFPRGRPHKATEGDENELIDAGYLCINRLDWIGEAPLEPGFLSALEVGQSITR